MDLYISLIALTAVSRTAESCWASSSRVSPSPPSPDSQDTMTRLDEANPTNPHNEQNSLVLDLMNYPFRSEVNATHFKLYCVFTKGNFTLEVEIGMKYTGVVGDQLLKCLACGMDGMGCYLVPLRSHSDEPEVSTSGDIPNSSVLKTTARARGVTAATWVLILPVLCIVT